MVKKNCKNCKWCSCKYYGYDRSACDMWIADKEKYRII